MLTVLLGIFATIALILTAVGLYGACPTRFPGRHGRSASRIALGATRRSITGCRAVARRTARGVGMVLGLAGSLAAGRVLASLLQTCPRTICGS